MPFPGSQKTALTKWTHLEKNEHHTLNDNTMSVEEVTTESWGSRLGNSFMGVITGGVLFLAGIPLLALSKRCRQARCI